MSSVRLPLHPPSRLPFSDRLRRFNWGCSIHHEVLSPVFVDQHIMRMLLFTDILHLCLSCYFSIEVIFDFLLWYMVQTTMVVSFLSLRLIQPWRMQFNKLLFFLYFNSIRKRKRKKKKIVHKQCGGYYVPSSVLYLCKLFVWGLFCRVCRALCGQRKGSQQGKKKKKQITAH